MKTRNLLSFIIMVAAMAFLMVSCENSDIKTTADFSIAEDDVLSTALFDDVFMEVDEAVEIADYQLTAVGSLKSGTVVCKTITVEKPDTALWPKTITVDYGDGCEGPNGRIRKGTIIITVTGRYMLEGSQRTVRFEDYYVNDFKMEGIKTITNQGRNDNDDLYFSIALIGGKVSNDSITISKDFSRTRTWISGEDTPRFHKDDEYKIEGSATGVNRRGISYTRTITSPLHTAVVCRWIKSGTVQIVADGKKDRIIDYGDGTCDNKATVTIGDKTREIELPKHRKKRS